MKITGTFIDEVSHDIPHQNWSESEWEQDFKYMQSVGIDTVVLIRCGYKKFQTFDSAILSEMAGCYRPPVDLVDLFLRLSDQFEMDFYLGLYDSGDFFENGTYEREVEINRALIDEVWKTYGHRKSFKGWYVSQETSRKSESIIEIYKQLGGYCKKVSGNLPVLISPFIDGRKAVLASDSTLDKTISINPVQHYKEWDEIFASVKDCIDIVAFQDGHVEYELLPEFMSLNRELAQRHGLRSWSNTESFDRDMPIKYLPIKWEKLLLKIRAAENAEVEKLITFEFSHFMSPQSAYKQAGHLYARYREYLQSESGT